MKAALTEQYDPEQPVIDAIRSGDRYAFGELVRRHDRWLRGVIFGVLGHHDRLDDVAQQAWATAWTRIAELRDASRWRAWLYRLARNAAIDAGRDISRRRSWERTADHVVATREESAGQGSASAFGSPDRSLAEGEERARMMAEIEKLPALYREPFVLRHLNGWSYREIAEVLDMPVDSVETRLVRARRQLRESLGRKQA